jgi:hypothetical protein
MGGNLPVSKGIACSGVLAEDLPFVVIIVNVVDIDNTIAFPDSSAQGVIRKLGPK